MARREFCTCCGKYVTLVQLAKHTEEAARQKNIITMGGDPTSPVTTTPGSIPPITGNDIFESRVVYETPSVVDEGISNTVPYTNSLPATSLPPYFTEDEDFPPGPVEGTPKPPQGPTPVDEYPSLYVPEDDDGDGSEDDDKDNNGNTDDGMPDLEKFMDWEYIKQAGNLSDYDMAICRAFALLIRTQLTNVQFEMIPEAYPDIKSYKSEHILRERAQALSGILPQRFDCCVNSCVCYAGHYSQLVKCPRCNEPRFEGVDKDRKPKPRSQFFYIPLIPRLIAYLGSPTIAKIMEYRGQFQHVDGIYRDIFDGTNYRAFCENPITVHGKSINPPANYFEDPRDIALGLSTDGYGIFTRSQATAWPLIIFNYNLPPQIRFHSENVLALGVIPGPNKPGDIDSFLIPLADELFQLASGVEAYDVLSKSTFNLHAFLLLVFGDFPAVSMLMKMKGVNAVSPCRSCSITAVPIPGERSNTHYIPLDTNLAGLGRSHCELMKQAKEVDQASTKAEAETLSKKYGIKGTSILSELDSLSFPQSFPPEFMHVAWENISRTLEALWSGDYKGLDEGKRKYRIEKAVWKEIGSRGAAASPTIPSTYGPRIPNISEKGSFMTADMWSFWIQFLAPILLRDSFKDPKCFEHFIDLVYLFGICLQREISAADIKTLRSGFVNWIKGYDEIYYQGDPKRRPVCTLPIHTLLHLADYIECWGPVWCYWAFPMERFCGHLKRGGAASKRFPYRSLDNYVFDWTVLWHVGTIYNVRETLRLLRRKKGNRKYTIWGYEGYLLTSPRPPPNSPTSDNNFLSLLTYDITARLRDTPVNPYRVWHALEAATFYEWGSFVRSNPPETFHAASQNTKKAGARNSLYARYEVLDTSQPIPYTSKTYYGCLQQVISVTFTEGYEDVHLYKGTTLVFALFRPCILTRGDPRLDRLNIHFYSKEDEQTLHVTDITRVYGLIGRVKDGPNSWAIIDRGNRVSRVAYLTHEDGCEDG